MPLHDFPLLFKAYLRTFQESPLNSSTFQACANPDQTPCVIFSFTTVPS